MPPSLYNLGPTLHLLVMGSLLAMLPLCWVWLRNPRASTSQRVQWLTWATLFLTFDLVMFGAFTRLTDSGLGCPDWPGCYGHASPLGAMHAIENAQNQMPSGPVTHVKAWIEMLHRYLAMAVGGLILVLTAFAWFRRQHAASHIKTQVLWPTLTLVWVCVQGAFGALTVTMKLFPLIVTLHLMGGLILVGLLTFQVQQQRLAALPELASSVCAKLRWLVAIGLLLVAVQVVLGGWVSTNYAVLACSTFPKCQDVWWPVMDFAQGFGLWRPLGLDTQGNLLAFPALTAIHYVHRLFAYAVFAYLGVLAWQLHRVSMWQYPARVLMTLLALQFVTGLSNVLLDWPLVSAVLHTGGAAALCATLVWMLADRAPQISRND